MTYTQQYSKTLLETLSRIDLARVDQAIAWLTQAREEGKWIFTCGNGGSASTASHFVCDMLKGASYQRPRKFKIMALTDSLPTLTAYANDVGYEAVFVEQLRNLAGPGDVMLAISGSGNSMNVVKAFEYANSIGCRTISLTGRDGGKLAKVAQLDIRVPDPHMGRIEDGHMVVCHMICYHFMDLEAPGR
jgi:D-sedoheptulose 7-phosphate isomerase